MPSASEVLPPNEAWFAFRKQWRPNKTYWDANNPPSDAEATAWRLWMTEVFVPLNHQIEQAIVSNADLLVENDIPKPLLPLCAHVAIYKPLKRRWELADYTEHHAAIDYPAKELREYVHSTFHRLKKEQSHLLGRAT